MGGSVGGPSHYGKFYILDVKYTIQVVYLKKQTITPIAGIILLTSGIATYLTNPNWISSTTGATGTLIGAGITALIITIWNTWQKTKKEVITDERDYKISEKASYKTFQISFTLTGLIFASISITKYQPPAQTVLGLIFALMGLSYILLFYHYRKKM